ncbi:MAG: GGDEF domain-containing protein [Xanthomonadaceae bacterium]|nr:GGDEF domain-containing protein [Xanthomonadaceae bacterium]
MTRSQATGRSPRPGAAVRVTRFDHAVPALTGFTLVVAACMALAVAGRVNAQPVRVQGEVQTLLARSESMHLKDPQQALSLARRAVQVAERAGADGLVRRSKAAVCEATVDIDPQAALPLSEDGEQASRAAEDLSALARFLGCRGYALEQLGKRHEAALVHESAVSVAERTTDRAALADALAMRGESRHYHGRYDLAIADLNRAYALDLALGRKDGQQYALNAIANVYSDGNVAEFDKAIAYYRQLLKDNEAAGLRSEVATMLFNIASANLQKGRLDEALADFRRAMAIDLELGNSIGVAESERSIGAVLAKQGHGDEALPLMDSALARFEAAGNDENAARVRISRARVLRMIGRHREALADLALAERHFQDRHNPRLLAQVYEVQADIHAGAGEWRKAYDALKAYRTTQELLEARAREEQGSRLRVQFDTAKKEQENRELLIENAHRGEALRSAENMRSLQRLTILLGTALVVLLAAMAVLQVRRGHHLRRLAMTDELTGMPNRRSILEYLEREIAGLRDGRAMSVITFDVDHFKRINDIHGHHGGDRVLRSIAGIIGTALPASARLGRMGGEEFLIVLPASGGDAAFTLAERLRARVGDASFEGFTADERVTISLGVSEGVPGDDVEILLRRADAALYRAKGEGRDRVVRG